MLGNPLKKVLQITAFRRRLDGRELIQESLINNMMTEPIFAFLQKIEIRLRMTSQYMNGFIAP